MPEAKQLSLFDSVTPPEISFKQARLIELWCAEPVFFASRELSDCYYTEGVFGNYALAYAMGWVNSPYRLTGKATGRPTYKEDLVPLAQECYILPAWPAEGKVTFRVERFNALSDAYWYAMTNNRVATAREDVPLWRELQQQGNKKPPSFKPSNYPQTGRLRLIDRGNRFHTLVLGEREIPEYIRLGKFRSKVRIKVLNQMPIISLPEREYESKAYLSVADLPSELNLLSFDLISMPPTSLLKNLHFSGAAWEIGDWTIPANLCFCGGRANYEP